MRIIFPKFFLAAFSSLLLSANISFAIDPTTQAMNMVRELYQKYGSKISKRPMECVFLNHDGVSPEGGISISARELRTPACGGDPSTTKMVASFVVLNGVVYVERFGTGELEPLDEKYEEKTN
jgi:hypothetical protein